MTIDHAERARALVGTRFRPQGRDPALGLDCVGLILCVFALPQGAVRRDYRLRGDHRDELLMAMAQPFRRIAADKQRVGDVVVMQVAPDQWHLGVATASGVVHADARLGRVVETPGVAPWPIVAVFRRRVRKRRQR